MLGRKHTRAEYLAVMLITAGVALFSLKPGTVGEALGKEGGADGENRLFGLALVRVRCPGARGWGGRGGLIAFCIP